MTERAALMEEVLAIFDEWLRSPEALVASVADVIRVYAREAAAGDGALRSAIEQRLWAEVVAWKSRGRIGAAHGGTNE